MQFVLSGIMVGSIYAIIAIGFNMIYNATEIVNFAQGEFVMLGGMVTVGLYKFLGFPLVFSCPLAVLITTIIGIAIERLTINQMKTFSVLNAVIITIGVSIVIKGGTMVSLGRDNMSFPPFSGDRPVVLFGAALATQGVWIILATVILVILLSLFYKHSIQGIAMKATSFNKTAAGLVGINVNRMVMSSFGLSAACGAIAGVIITPITLTAYDIGLMLGLKGFSAAIIGGLGNFWGAVIGGLFLGLCESLGAGFVSSGYKDAIAFIILLGVLFLRPTGLFGTKPMREE